MAEEENPLEKKTAGKIVLEKKLCVSENKSLKSNKNNKENNAEKQNGKRLITKMQNGCMDITKRLLGKLTPRHAFN